MADPEKPASPEKTTEATAPQPAAPAPAAKPRPAPRGAGEWSRITVDGKVIRSDRWAKGVVVDSVEGDHRRFEK